MKFRRDGILEKLSKDKKTVIFLKDGELKILCAPLKTVNDYEKSLPLVSRYVYCPLGDIRNIIITGICPSLKFPGLSTFMSVVMADRKRIKDIEKIDGLVKSTIGRTINNLNKGRA